MSRNRALGVGLLLLASIAAIGWWHSSTGSRLIAPDRATETDVANESPAAPDVASALQAERADDPPPVVAGVSDESPPLLTGSSPTDVDTRACVKGRLLLADGSVAAGVRLKLHGWGANGERLARYGNPERWDDVNAVSDAHGRFALRFDPPRAFQFTLDATLDSHAAASWRWSEIEPGATVDVGDVVMRRAGSIQGRLVDGRGEALVGQEWRVHFEGAPSVPGADETRGSEAVDPATATFVLAGVPPGPVKLTAHSELANWIDGPLVEVRAGETTSADIVFAGVDLAQRITITLFSRPFHICVDDDIDAITVTGTAGEPRRASKIEGSSQSWCVDGVPPGSYTVEVRDRRTVPWKKEGVAPGTRVSARLKGNAAVQLAVVDAATGDPLPSYSLTVWFDEFQGSPDRFELLAAGSPAPADGLFDGLIPTNQTLLVRAAGYAECAVPLHPLEPNEVRRVTARLDHGATLSGVVWNAGHSSPAAVTKVRLRARNETDDGEEPTFRIRSGNDEENGTVETATDSEGRFRFEQVATGHYTLRAGLPPDLEAKIGDLDVRADCDTLELVLPPSGWVVGRLVAAPGASFNGMVVDVALVNGDSSANERYVRAVLGTSRRAGVQSDGHFRVGPFPAGESRVLLQLPDIKRPIGTHSYSGNPGPTLELGTVVVPESGETVVEFDLRDRFPGRLKVHVDVEGASAKGAVVEVRERRRAAVRDDDKIGDPAKDAIDDGGGVLLASGTVDSRGVALVGPIPAGVVELLVRGLSSEWAFWSDDPITVAPGAEVSVALAGRVFAGVVTIAGESEKSPDAFRMFELGKDLGESTDYDFHATPDAEGRLHLCLPSGKYRLLMSDDEGEHTGSFEWTESGPLSSRVVMEMQPWSDR